MGRPEADNQGDFRFNAAETTPPAAPPLKRTPGFAPSWERLRRARRLAVSGPAIQQNAVLSCPAPGGFGFLAVKSDSGAQKLPLDVSASAEDQVERCRCFEILPVTVTESFSA